MQKLVRDRIPEIIRRRGGNPRTHIVEGFKYLRALSDKLSEETGELVEAFEDWFKDNKVSDEVKRQSVINELADCLEVIYTIGISIGVSAETIEDARAAKKIERGGFGKGVILVNPKTGNGYEKLQGNGW